ncbi:MAG TPA: hypothetical protein VG165_06700 [Solirubrobacteraceae bacterium]|jgi:hypothetical protein|nr:hypothetical protein [Solirubrobacteraceae bacterium]
MTLRSWLAPGSIAVLACLAVSTGAAASPSTSSSPGVRLASAATACKPPHYPSLGYFTSLTVTRTTCAAGNRLVLAFYKCRTKSGLTGRCRKTVLGFKCTEIRNSISTEIDALDTCRHGSEKIVSGWQQDIN